MKESDGSYPFCVSKDALYQADGILEGTTTWAETQNVFDAW
jgi:hypothetical protein